MKKIRRFAQDHWIYILITFLFILWALYFIYNSSYTASNKVLYFSLFDDAMISMRYGWNLAHGNGLVWNTGEAIEGYTNLLMTLLMAAVSLFLPKRLAVLAIQLTGIFFVTGTAFFTLQILKRQGNFSQFPKYLVYASSLLYYPLNYWALMGMETGMLAFLVSAGVYCSILYSEELKEKYLWFSVLCFDLTYLTRNDAMLYAVIAFLFMLPILKANKRYLAAILLYSLFPVTQTIFRYYYYGEIVPNTYVLKLQDFPLDIRLFKGLNFAVTFLRESWFLVITAFLGLSLKINKRDFFLFGLFLVSILYDIYRGGDPWSYWRMTAPVMPLIILMTITAGYQLLNKISTGWPEFIHSFSLLMLLVVGLFMANFRFLGEMFFTEIPYDSWDAKRHIELAIFINNVTYENATVGVFWAGTLPYYVDRKAVDFLGKSDAYIANLPPDLSSAFDNGQVTSPPGHNKYDLTYSIQTLLPTYVEGFVWGNQDLTQWRDEYYVKTTNKYVEIYLLKDSPDVNWDKVKIAKH
jgi:hypothetical protein